MSIIRYHGTDCASAQAIQLRTSLVDVTRGGGELGRGFYLGDSPVLALQLAIGRFGVSKARALCFRIALDCHSALNHKELDERSARKLRSDLRRKGATRTHLLGVDVVSGPIEGRPERRQEKFESLGSQNVLNDPACTTIEAVR